MKLTHFLLALAAVLVVIVAFELGLLLNRAELSKSRVAGIQNSQLQQEIAKLETELQGKETDLGNLNEMLVNSKQENEQLAKLRQAESQLRGQIRDLQTKLAELEKQQSQSQYPLRVPSNGTLATEAGSFNGHLPGMIHKGVDIWTTVSNNGRTGNHKGNPVYAACAGKVTNIFPPNGAVTIDCTEIPASYDLPAHKVYTHYSHMGHAETKELYIVVRRNQNVAAGDLLGYQGDLSSYFPNMRNVHLHFSVFTGLSETDPRGGAIDPCIYIGGDCSQPGQVFRV